ncbi:SpoIIE family protein phosphatase [Streptomyces acidicola]|uniref:SpoIIE family protein phosphatase n=1 Tax=Streptomyces acidicola TaxID=2596892 RepID=A0A5N8WZE4_9ACTN|nr:SpoIIE family protein phosphatase [Streptomyces acidicola]MPY51948.1 SpoIIE family protein phosphatase [Streptomyces acidicola]
MGTDRNSGVTRQRFDVADAAPLLLDARGTVTCWTRDAQRLLGYPAAEVVGRSVAELLVPEDAARLSPLAEAYRGRGGWSGVLTARHRHGGRVRLMVRAVPMRGNAPAGNTPAGNAPAGNARTGTTRTGTTRTGTTPAGLVPESGRAAHWILLLSDMADAPGWDMSRFVLERMVVQSPVGIAMVDTDLRFVWSNTALETFGGGPAHQRIGLRLADVQPGLDAQRIEAVMRQVLRTGETVVDYEHVGRFRSAPHRETAHVLTFTRLDDDQGNPLGVYYTVVDVSERHRARQRLALLDRAGEQIGRTLDVARTAQELADVAVPELADFVAVDLLESVLKGADPGPVRGADAVPLRRAGQQSVNAGVPETVVGIGGLAAYLPGTPPVLTLTGGTSWYRAQLDPLAKEWSDTLPGGREATFLDLGLHTVMIVPIRARGITLGITTFFRGEGRMDPFDEVDLGLAEELVSRAAVCVDNARRYTRERSAALVLQRSLLPRRLPEQDAVEVAACYRPADELTGLGGDWYDVIPLSGARVALVVGEVPGHGIDGAAAMGRLRTAVRTLADLDLPPEEVVAHLDDLVAKSARQEGDDPGAGSGHTVGARCLYVVHDPVSGECVMASAGLPAPALITPDGTVTFADDLPIGPALGVDGPPFESLTLSSLPPGTLIALHTDGLLAEAGPDMLCRALAGSATAGGRPPTGAGRTEERRTDGRRTERGRTERGRTERGRTERGRTERGRVVANPPPDVAPASLDRRAQTVVDALVPERPYDDVVLLLARTRQLNADRVASWDLPADPALVAQARRTTIRQLDAWGLEELAFTTELVVSELVTNAIRHATGAIRLRLILERTLICEVFDGGATAPHLRHPRATDEGGRGLFLISRFTQRWGTRFLPEGKVIWAEQSLTGPPG